MNFHETKRIDPEPNPYENVDSKDVLEKRKSEINSLIENLQVELTRLTYTTHEGIATQEEVARAQELSSEQKKLERELIQIDKRLAQLS